MISFQALQQLSFFLCPISTPCWALLVFFTLFPFSLSCQAFQQVFSFFSIYPLLCYAFQVLLFSSFDSPFLCYVRLFDGQAYFFSFTFHHVRLFNQSIFSYFSSLNFFITLGSSATKFFFFPSFTFFIMPGCSTTKSFFSAFFNSLYHVRLSNYYILSFLSLFYSSPRFLFPYSVTMQYFSIYFHY